MSALILINTTTVMVSGASSKRFPGETVTDPALQSTIAASGGQLVAPSAGLTAAAALATKLRTQGADETQLLSVMLAAYTAYVATLAAAETAAAVAYVDGAPAFGSTNVQGALDAVKADLTAIDSSVTTIEGDITAIDANIAALPTFQSGGGTLTSGASGNIAATITASSRIVVTRTAVNASTALGELAVTNKSVGAPGHFVVDALTPATPGTPLASDVSSFDWVVMD
jgi:hypothetical protein